MPPDPPKPDPNHAPALDPARSARIARAAADWFTTAARDLPWRTQPRDPYRSLVSEFMLQQTQVSRVLEKFPPFLKRFPSLAALAAAPEQDVLAAWSGLGYYRRARLLHAAAKAIAARHDHRVPADPEQLAALPGIGRYTAGAIASIVFNRPAPIVDGNIARVLLRIQGRPERPGHPPTDRWLWRAAADLASAADHPARTNEALMELGATLCTPANPSCPACPVRDLCIAHARGATATIPLPKAAAERSDLHALSLAVHDGAGRFLLERRPPSGLWASLWQCPTLERPDRPPTPAAARKRLNDLALDLTPAGALLIFEHQTSHRRLLFEARLARAKATPPLPDTFRWLAPADLDSVPISNAQHRILRAALERTRILSTS